MKYIIQFIVAEFDLINWIMYSTFYQKTKLLYHYSLSL